MKISYAITVCNEYEELEHLIDHISTLMRVEDEIVVVYDQNRVTEEVHQVLKDKPQCKSYPFNFQQNFLENKNYLGTKCTGDYIFQIDADEIPHWNLIQSLAPILEENGDVDVFVLPRINIVSNIGLSHVQKWGWNISKLENIIEEREFDLDDLNDLDEYNLLKQYNLIIEEG